MASHAADSVPMPNYEFLQVAGLNSIAHLVPKSKGRCGIYVLLFRNGDRYVGQAVDVSNRFGAHRRTYVAEDRAGGHEPPRTAVCRACPVRGSSGAGTARQADGLHEHPSCTTVCRPIGGIQESRGTWTR